ncbi:hypothetical protein AK812_SmicGene44998 [Symbiodinium microadriaticum]|uniref:Uncharacterized protein n=1 Tax=Symbiodinium microadriaticum TaxID=2951 RepID=A0A1Q9BX35_SYMMI|nr:hypothetical protein AK812_SmicGene44998 [Symbiodinium microadriaticum]
MTSYSGCQTCQPLSCAVLAAVAVRVGAKSRSHRSRIPKLAQAVVSGMAKAPPQPKAKAASPVAAGGSPPPPKAAPKPPPPSPPPMPKAAAAPTSKPESKAPAKMHARGS